MKDKLMFDYNTKNNSNKNKKKKKLRCYFKICAYTIVDDMFYSCHICYTIVDKVIKSLLDN